MYVHTQTKKQKKKEGVRMRKSHKRRKKWNIPRAAAKLIELAAVRKNDKSNLSITEN